MVSFEWQVIISYVSEGSIVFMVYDHAYICACYW